MKHIRTQSVLDPLIVPNVPADYVVVDCKFWLCMMSNRVGQNLRVKLRLLFISCTCLALLIDLISVYLSNITCLGDIPIPLRLSSFFPYNITSHLKIRGSPSDHRSIEHNVELWMTNSVRLASNPDVFELPVGRQFSY